MKPPCTITLLYDWLSGPDGGQYLVKTGCDILSPSLSKMMIKPVQYGRPPD